MVPHRSLDEKIVGVCFWPSHSDLESMSAQEGMDGPLTDPKRRHPHLRERCREIAAATHPGGRISFCPSLAACCVRTQLTAVVPLPAGLGEDC